MLDTGKIIGLPLKIFSNKNVYIPYEYLRLYGISEKKDKLLLDIRESSLFYRPYCESQRGDSVSRTIKAGLTALPAAWLRKNGLIPGDRVFLLGTTAGLLIYTKPVI